MHIIITGTPGTGKTEITHELSLMLGIPAIDVKKIVKENNIFIRKKELIVDLKKLRPFVLNEIKRKEDTIIDSHLLCEMRLPADFVFVLRTEPKTLKKRLGKRGYTKTKIDENLLCEKLDYCLLKSELNYRCIILQVDTTKSKPLTAAKRIATAIKHKKKSLDNVDYSKQLTDIMGG